MKRFFMLVAATVALDVFAPVVRAKLAEDRRRMQAMTAEDFKAEIAELDRKIALAENSPAKTNGAGSAHRP